MLPLSLASGYGWGVRPSCLVTWIFVAAAAAVVAAPARTAIKLDWHPLPSLPDPLGVAAPFAGVSQGALLVAGGANFPGRMPWEGGTKVWHDRVWLLDRPDGAWREAGRLPRALAYGVSATAQDGLVCVGGSDASQHYADAFRLVWNGKRLVTEALPRLPLALAGACGAVLDGTLYVAGGAERPGEQAASRRVFALDLGQNSAAWRELPPLPGKARFLATPAAHGGAFYVIGGVALEPQPSGRIARVYLRDAWRYADPDAAPAPAARFSGSPRPRHPASPRREWIKVADLPEPLAASPSPAPVVDGRLWLLGGDDGSRVGFKPEANHPGFSTRMFAYDPANDRWDDAGSVPAARATLPCAAWRDRFVLPSGEVSPGVRSPHVWSFRPAPP